MERSSPERPLAAYGTIMAAYTLMFVGPLAVAAKRGALPARPRFADLALVSVGTFKLSRLLTTDAVTGFIRAPFVRFERMDGVTTPKESPRGTGLQRAIGQLLLCPACAGLWVASALTAALVTAPRATRVACGALTVAAASDFLQKAHKAAPAADGGSDNLFEPVPLAVGATGRFGDEVHTRAVRVPAPLARGALVASAVAAAAGLAALGRLSKNGK